MLSHIPNSLPHATPALQHIFLAGNCLQEFPSSLAALPHLKNADLSFNRISALRFRV